MTLAEFAGLAAIVTCGGIGIREAIVAAPIERGCQVAVLDPQPTERLPRSMAVRVGLSDDDFVCADVVHAAERLCGIDIVDVYCAGISARAMSKRTVKSGIVRFDVNIVEIAGVPHYPAMATRRISPGDRESRVGSRPRRRRGPSLVQRLERCGGGYDPRDGGQPCRGGIRVHAAFLGTANTPWVERRLSNTRILNAASEAPLVRQPLGSRVSASEVGYGVASPASPSAGATTGTIVQTDGSMATYRASARL